MHQVEISFQPGLTEQFPAFRDVLRAAVYGCGRPFKHIAADLDMTQSKLSRMLADNPNDKINFPADRVPELVQVTGDLRPVHWLVETFLEDEDARRKRAVDKLVKMVPEIDQALRVINLQTHIGDGLDK